MFITLIEKLTGRDLERGVSWFNPPLNESALLAIEEERVEKYLTFRADAKRSDNLSFLSWSRDRFEKSGYVRSHYTTDEVTYFRNNIEGKKDILFVAPKTRSDVRFEYDGSVEDTWEYAFNNMWTNLKDTLKRS